MIRHYMPDASLSADAIVGFPGDLNLLFLDYFIHISKFVRKEFVTIAEDFAPLYFFFGCKLGSSLVNFLGLLFTMKFVFQVRLRSNFVTHCS